MRIFIKKKMSTKQELKMFCIIRINQWHKYKYLFYFCPFLRMGFFKRALQK